MKNLTLTNTIQHYIKHIRIHHMYINVLYIHCHENIKN